MCVKWYFQQIYNGIGKVIGLQNGRNDTAGPIQFMIMVSDLYN